MKNTGIIRHIDDLGRVMLPKEIRRTLRIREGDAMEIWVDENDGVVFRKHNETDGFKKELEAAVNSLSAGFPEVTFVICDRDADPLFPKYIDTLEISETILLAAKTRHGQRAIYRDSGLPVEAHPIVVDGEVFAVMVAVCKDSTDSSIFDMAVKTMAVQVHMLKQIAEH